MFCSSAKITKKLTRRMFIVYSCVFLVFFFIILSILLPLFFNNAKQTAVITVNLIKDNYLFIQDSMSQTLNVLISLRNFSNLLQNYKYIPSESNYSKINLYLSMIQTSHENNLFLMVEDFDKNVFSSISYSQINVEDFIRQNPNYQNLYSINKKYYSQIYHDYFINDDKTINIPFCYLSHKYILNNNPYIITLCYNMSGFLKFANTLSETAFDDYIIINRNNECVYTTSDILKSQIFDNSLIAQMKSEDGIIKKDGGYYFYNKVLQNGHIIIGYASTATLLSDFMLLIRQILIIFIIPPLIYYLFLIPTHDKYLYPLKKLSKQMSSFSIGQIPPKILKTEDEIEDLSRIFNGMVQKINMQAEKIKIKEREKAITFYKLLTTQINPHFVCNTLNIINILTKQQRIDDVIMINNALIRIIRDRLNTNSAVFATVEEEIITLKQYMIIMNCRYTNNVKVVCDIDEKVKKEKIIKNVLQPIVENAFYHGLVRDDGSVYGNISIMIYLMDSHIIIEISDDGKGIEKELLEQLRMNNFNITCNKNSSNTHIGLNNIYQRLKYIYDKNFDIQIKSEVNYGTTFMLSLPRIEDTKKFV